MAEKEKVIKLRVWAVLGASNNPQKFGYKITKALNEAGKTVNPINPKEETILGLKSYSDITQLPQTPEVIDFVVPKEVGKSIIDTGNIPKETILWFQPGSFDDELVQYAQSKGYDVVSDGCVLVELRNLI
ncbi:CoA-binding protein [Alkalicella caledoniensis]|uniref:CoA-binding protein n=1 Tax=Alkalicella caledoniensis TaxID=2731377 RepID=A0A7G9W828_ALKCA|nr:CoA-binding protein [Alkalicella caledoniensis]QNO14840.1 CoA-binding protein [Alkalicella caledoniensis]